MDSWNSLKAFPQLDVRWKVKSESAYLAFQLSILDFPSLFISSMKKMWFSKSASFHHRPMVSHIRWSRIFHYMEYFLYGRCQTLACDSREKFSVFCALLRKVEGTRILVIVLVFMLLQITWKSKIKKGLSTVFSWKSWTRLFKEQEKQLVEKSEQDMCYRLLNKTLINRWVTKKPNLFE